MIRPFFAEVAFIGTTVNPVLPLNYLFEVDMGYYRAAYQAGESEDALGYLAHVEVIEIKLRRYIAGFYKTLHGVLAEVRSFLSDDNRTDAVVGLIQTIVRSTRDFFLSQEWYELMPRLEKAARRIESVCLEAIS